MKEFIISSASLLLSILSVILVFTSFLIILKAKTKHLLNFLSLTVLSLLTVFVVSIIQNDSVLIQILDGFNVLIWGYILYKEMCYRSGRD